MVRRISPHVEGLEERALLSSVSSSLTANQAVYQVGQAVELSFTETNTGDTAITIEVAPTDFTVSQNGTVLWQSDPANAGQPPTSETLLPGQSVSQTASWDGLWSYHVPAAAGASQTVPINAFGSFVVTNRNAPATTATFQITDPISRSLTTDQAVYQLGEPVRMTYTQVNTSDQSITVLPSPPAGFRITHNGKYVLIDALPQYISVDPVTIAPGQTTTVSQTWDGIPMSGPDDLTGTFVAAYGPGNDPTELTATFQVVSTTNSPQPSPSPIPPPAPVAATLSTAYRTYKVGESIPISLILTDLTASKVAVTPSPAVETITVHEGSTLVYDRARNVHMRPAAEIKPGHPLVLTARWPGKANQPDVGMLTPGTYTITVDADGYIGSTAVRIVPRVRQ